MTKSILAFVLALAVAATTVSARSKKVILTIHSNPEGALLTENGKRWGATPFALAYDAGKFKECLHTPPVSVRWASGAEAALSRIALCPAVGTNQSYTFDRPADVDGLALDLQVAYQQAMLAQMQAQANALDELNYQSWLSTLNNSQRSAAAPKPFVLCVTNDVARGVVYVACR